MFDLNPQEKLKADPSAGIEPAHVASLHEPLLKQTVQAMQAYLATAPGIVVRLGRAREEPLINEAAGEAQAGVSLSPNDCFRIASHTKMLTAIAVVQLLGIDRLEAHVSDFFAELKDTPLGSATVRQLLTHTSGLARGPRPGEQMDLADLQRYYNANMVGTFDYSNAGYVLLGQIIERCSGRSYQQYVRENIINRLYSAADMPRFDETTVVTGHKRTADGFTTVAHEDIGWLAPAGGLIGDADFLCRLGHALSDGNETLLDEASKKEMFREAVAPGDTKRCRDFPGGYGLGFVVFHIEDRTFVGHSGAVPGFESCTIMDPKTGVVLSVLTNGEDGTPTQFAKSLFGDALRRVGAGRAGT